MTSRSSRSISTLPSFPPLPSIPSTSCRRTSSLLPRSTTYNTRSVSAPYTPRSVRTPRRSTTATSAVSGRRSRSASTIGASENHQIICAVSEARGVTPSVGVAFVNISTGEAVLSQICDTQFYIKALHKISLFEPNCILIVSTSCPPNLKSSLYSSIEENCPGIRLVPLDRKYWSENTGLEYIHNHAFREDVEAIKVAIDGNFYSTCAFSAAMRYLESEHSVRFAPHSLRVKYQPSEETMMIDLSTIASLELIQNLHNTKSKNCLFGLLNQTLTPMGARMLRSNILQPSTQQDGVLDPRYDALDELCSKEDMFYEIRKALQGFDDAEKLLTRLIILPTQVSLHHTEQAINSVLMVKRFLLSVTPVWECLGPARCALLTRIRDLCRPEVINPILELISNTMNDDATYVKKPLELRNQRTYAVKAGVNGLLDVARKTYKEATDDMYEHIEELNSKFEVTLLAENWANHTAAELDLAGDIKYDNNRRYWLRFLASDFESRPMPDVFINRVKKKAYIECQTLSIVKLNQRIANSAEEVVMMSDKVVQELLDSIRTRAPQMFRVCEGIALLDMIASFCHTVTSLDYVRPALSGTLALKTARHPILEKSRISRFIPNDYYATEQYRFQVITGCNMSGKSTYIRTAALLQVMAQIGCFVPAQYASFSIVHNLFSRVSTDDSIEANMSTFSFEMREMAFILRNITGNSLTIIDELGRGTSTRDGLAIAISMAEALVQSGSLVLFATHFTELAKVLADRPGVLNLHLVTETSRTEDDLPKMTMLYKVSSGPVQEENYGIKLAGAIGFPPSFLQVAEHVSDTLRDQAEAKKRSSHTRKLALRRRLVLNLHEALQQAHESDMNDGALATYLRKLQDEFIRRMEEIDSIGAEGGDQEAEAAEVEDVDEE